MSRWWQGLVTGACLATGCWLAVSWWRRRGAAGAPSSAVTHSPEVEPATEPAPSPAEEPEVHLAGPVEQSERRTIEHAVQMLSHRHSTSAADAADMLERVAAEKQVPVHRLAVQVVAGVPLDQEGMSGPSVLGK
jgi:hypothetical protein